MAHKREHRSKTTMLRVGLQTELADAADVDLDTTSELWRQSD